MSRYRKFDPRFWKDERVRSLDVTDKAIVAYCITGQSNRIGLFNFSPGQASEDLGIPLQTSLKRFRNVCQKLNLPSTNLRACFICQPGGSTTRPRIRTS